MSAAGGAPAGLRAVTTRSPDDCVTAITRGKAGCTYKCRGPIRAASPSPDTPTPPGSQEPQVEATTCRDPESVDFPGFIFMAVNEPSENYPRVLLRSNSSMKARLTAFR